MSTVVQFEFKCSNVVLDAIKVALHTIVAAFAETYIAFQKIQLKRKYLPKKPTTNLPDSSPSNGPSSPIVAATPTFKHLVVPRDAEKTEETKVNQNRVKDCESYSSTITDLRTSSTLLNLVPIIGKNY